MRVSRMRKAIAMPVAASLLLAGLAAGALAAEPVHGDGSEAGHAQPYAGQQHRAIASVSDAEIAEYREGRGMGLARPAELNGYPGPMHVLELARELDLTREQQKAVEAIHARMKAAARSAGARYLEAEKAVDAAFRSGEATADRISGLVRQADNIRAEVRLAHLAAHLETAPLLSAEQRRRYSELRGYAGGSGDHRHQHRR
ncbi:MAG: Spy/CpxP family protein refolding chaperone [Hyphomicrobiaceae bacterium]|nr:Spy/CpxP family protein refolding chaperone [Hyphomicrobiaceae bacterium]